MKLNAGIITDKLGETKVFYTDILGFGITFENEFYLLLHTPGQQAEISFLLPNHSSQQPLFHKPFQRQGMYLTIEVDDVDKWYSELKEKGVEIKIELRDEPWGDRHFAIEDPNGIGIDIVEYTDDRVVEQTNGQLTCKLTTPELRKRKETVIAALKQKLLEKKELANGYAYKFPDTDELLDELAEFIKTERTCCDFFSFGLSVSGDQREAWLELTGAEGVKEFIKSELNF